jgi:hypothetical protein
MAFDEILVSGGFSSLLLDINPETACIPPPLCRKAVAGTIDFYMDPRDLQIDVPLPPSSSNGFQVGMGFFYLVIYIVNCNNNYKITSTSLGTLPQCTRLRLASKVDSKVDGASYLD